MCKREDEVHGARLVQSLMGSETVYEQHMRHLGNLIRSDAHDLW